MPDPIEKFLSSYEAAVSDTAVKVRQMVNRNVKGVIERLDVPARMIMYSLGPGYKGMVCTIIPSKKGVKLGFYLGTELPDPSKILTGSGKVHRHVEIKSESDIRSGDLKNLLTAAVNACKKRLA